MAFHTKLVNAPISIVHGALFQKAFSVQCAQIREQMSGPDLHVFTLKFLAQKKLVFPP